MRSGRKLVLGGNGSTKADLAAAAAARPGRKGVSSIKDDQHLATTDAAPARPTSEDDADLSNCVVVTVPPSEDDEMHSGRNLGLGGNGATKADLAAAAAARPWREGVSSIRDDPHLATTEAAPARPTSEDDVDLSTGVAVTAAPSVDDEALQKRAKAFVTKFYNLFNSNQKNIHTLYTANGHLVLTLYAAHNSHEIRTATDIKDFWASFEEPLMSCHPHCFVVQQKGDVTLIVVNGSCCGYAPSSTNFVESIVLNTCWKILSDVLFVFKDGKPIKMPRVVKQKQEEFLAAENSNLVRRRSARIEQNSRLKICKSLEAEASITIGAKSRMDAGIRERAIQKRPEAEISITRGAKSRTDASFKEQTFQKDAEIAVCAESGEGISVAILYDDVMLEHKPDYYCLNHDARMIRRKSKCPHLEKPERISCIIKRLREDNLFDRTVHIRHNPATRDDVLAVHHADYVDFIDQLPLSPIENDKFADYFTHDMYCSIGTCKAAYSAAGATIKACDLVIRDQFKKAFAIVRPPGHHVAEDVAEGFCYINNVAVAADYLKRIHGIKKKLVVDWDVHHGNGSEKLFYSTDEVLFFNIYNIDLDYPETSKQQAERIGRGKGFGHNVNIPLFSDYGDSDMLYIWEKLLIPLLKEYAPDIIIISAGYDAAKGDPIGQAEVTSRCYATLLDMLVNAGNGRIVLSLEGGYNHEVVADCASHCVRAMVGDKDALLPEDMGRAPPLEDTIVTVKEVKRHLSRFWDVFKDKRKNPKR